jgi:SAM-dependent methyltransferase
MDQAQADRLIEFTCNLCGNSNKRRVGELRREQSSCLACGSTVRTRGVLRALSQELFGTNLTVPDFPQLKSLRGIGTSDEPQYASRLAEKFDYRNTFYDRPPRFDIAHPNEAECGQYDFMISSEVFEHVPPPAEAAFANAYRLLKPNGVLVLTVPYSIEDRSLEHFPELYDYSVTWAGAHSVLVNRTREGLLQVFDNLVFHADPGARAGGAPLELREFSEHDLTAMLTGVGFQEVRVHGESFEPFGIVWPEPWSLPIAARKGTYALSLDSAREIMEQWTKLQADLDRMRLVVDSFQRAAWMRLGRALRLIGGGGRLK